ncbi:hypothetical protein Tsubulata_009887, partial [Turnera subulata]
SAQGTTGVNYGKIADNLPTPDKVIALLKSKNIARIRIFEPYPDVLQALQGSGLQVIVGSLNNDLPQIGSDPAFAAKWVQTNVAPFASTVSFRCISLGNELIPSELAQTILPAMQGLQRAIIAANLSIPVTTTVHQAVLSASYPPSAGTLSPGAANFLVPIAQFLKANNYPLLFNAYTYFPYRDNQKDIRIDYALNNATEVVVRDGNLGYTNLLDASVDAFYYALEKGGVSNLENTMHRTIFFAVTALLVLTHNTLAGSAQGTVGVNYGKIADNLPPPDKVIALLKSKNISRIRIFEPYPDVLQALQGSGLQVIVGSLNSDLPQIGSDPAFAAKWVQTNVVPFASNVSFRCISLGNELIPSELAQTILPAMQGLQRALVAANLSIAVTTTVIVSETGWPSAGGDAPATIINAQTYNQNMINRMKNNVGTPKSPGKGLEIYIFALFNENLKASGTEQHFGLFYPTMEPVYPIQF